MENNLKAQCFGSGIKTSIESMQHTFTYRKENNKEFRRSIQHLYNYYIVCLHGTNSYKYKSLSPKSVQIC